MNNLQRTPEWYLERKGMITASEIVKLLGDHDEPMSETEIAEYLRDNPKGKRKNKTVPFNDTSYTYLRNKLAERYMPDAAYLEYVEDSQSHAKATEWGTLFESDAIERYAKETGYEIFDVGFIPLKGYDRFAGGSPDGMIRQDKGIIEVKCPYTPSTYIEHYLLATPQEVRDMKNGNVKGMYYAQMQMNMLVTECDFCDFVSFDPRVSRSKQIKILRIPRDETMCNEILNRISIAIEWFRDQMNIIDKQSIFIK